MNDGSWRVPRMQAFAYLKTLERPPSLSPRQWRGVKEFLYVVARGQPRMYWGQEKIAKHMNVSVRTVKYYVDWACAAGLLTVWVNAGTGKHGNARKTHQYLLTELLELGAVSARTVGAESAHKDTGALRNPCISKKDTPCPELRSEHSVSCRPPAGPQPNLPAVGKLSASEALAAASEQYIKRRPRAKDPDASRRLVNYFLDQWESVLQVHRPVRHGSLPRHHRCGHGVRPYHVHLPLGREELQRARRTAADR